MNILLVAQPSDEQAGLADCLRGLGYEVVVGESGDAALALSQQTFYPLIILDLEAAAMAGDEFCRRLRALKNGEFSMILGMTSQPTPAALQTMLDAGLCDYLLKPIEPAYLQLRLKILERHLACLTKHQQTEEALRMSQTYAGNIIESSLDMIIAVDMARRIVEFNKAAQQTFGYRLEEVLGQHVKMLYADETEAVLVSQITLAQGRCVREVYNRRQNGENFPCLLSASIMHDMKGQPIGMMGISRDITERKRVEEALRVSQEYAHSIIESSLDMIIAVDTDRRIVEFNKAAQEAFGYRLEDVLGQHINLLYADETESAATSRTVIEQGRSVREIYNKRKNGDIFPCLLSASILRDAQGNPVGFMGISRDITERKRVEAALQKAHAELEQQNVELARASQLKDDFLSVMSHELRTPLTTILCQAELLQEGIYGDLNDRQLPAIESIGQSGRELSALINDILDFSKIVQGKIELQLAPVAVAALCQESLQAIRQAAAEKQIHVSFRIDEQATSLQADRQRLQQVLHNLLGNAVKFTSAGGAVGLEVHGDRAQRRLYFTVWDTGIGIAAEDLGRIFQPFEQLHSGLTREYEGAGLGLAIACRVVNLHDGTISVESEPGKGSRFTVSLPWQEV